MKEHFAQFNLFDHVSVNNERLGVIVDFDYIVPISDAVDSEDKELSEAQKINQDCGRAFSELEEHILTEDEVNKAIESELEQLADDVESKTQNERRVLESEVINQVHKPIVAKSNVHSSTNSRARLHMSNLNQFISAEMLEQVEKEHVGNQVFYWVLCEQDDNPVMAYVPEELVTSANEAPSERLLENLDIWRSQTNIQYRH